jgi:hypothetical protein
MFYHLWFIALFLLGSLLANASTDITTAKGTDQPVIAQLTPQPGSSVSMDTAIKAQFNIDLDPTSVQKNNVKLKCLSCDNQGVIQGDASYVAGDRRVVFSHPEPLNAGIYEVEYKSLKPTKANKDIKIGEIKYRFEVTAFIPDTTPPVITLNGANPLQLFIGQTYEEKGATAVDEIDGNISVEISGTVDTSTAGNYTVTYSATDTSGNQSQTTRTVIVTAPQLLSLNLEANATSLNMGEKASLTLIGSYEDNSSKVLTDQIEWIVTPSGAASISGTVLTALKDTALTIQAKSGTLLSNTVSLELYWEVNGHRLPPEPDKTLNDSTLLGIDTNNNGVRDDVERWIYKTYDHPIERGIFMQSARAYQKVIVDPSKAHETMKYIDDASDCEGYWRYWKILYKDRNESYILERYRDLEKEIRPIQFNTLKRHMAYERFNATLSGGVYTSGGTSKDKCEFDENGTLKDL